MKLRWICFAIMLLLLSAIPIQAAVPKSEKEIPIFLGTVRDQAAEKELLRQDSEYGEDIVKTWRSNTVKVYTVKKIIDDVAAFYIQKLGAKEGAPDNFAPKPGAVLPPWYEPSCYEPDIFKDQYDDKGKLFYDGKWVKSAFSQRKQWSKNEWLSVIRFEWNIVLNNGDMAQYSVLVEDEGYDALKKVIFNSTRITVRIQVTKSQEALTDEQDQAMDQGTAKKASQLAKNPPTEKTLGVPIYPGSIFDPENSAGMSLDGDYQYYIYLSNDPPSKVTAFYEQRLGKKAMSNEGGYMIALKGQLPVPEEGLTIQPNTMFGGKAKTVITVQKQNGTVPTLNPTQPPASNTITSNNGYVLVNNGGQNYIVQNNVRSSTGTTQTITYSGNSFKVTAFNGESPTNAAPGSFPSVFIGKCRTNETPSVGLPKQNSSCSSIPVSWSWSATSVSGTYNALFELWFSISSSGDSGDSGEPSGGKLIVWLASPSGPRPTGSIRNIVSISSDNYNVWYGTLNGTPCVTYVTKSTDYNVAIDLNQFIKDAISRGYITNSHYLTAIFAGFQIWKGGVGLESKSLSIHVK